MHLGKSQDHFTDQLALWRRQLQEGVESFALQVTHALIPALAVRLQMTQSLVTKAQLLRLQSEQMSEFLQLVLRRDRLAI